jgi:zinc/manganese transport system ATP-binding protein
MSVALRLANVTASYERHPAVHHVSGEIAEGSMTAIVGPNGAGKSTLLKAILGVGPTVEGGIEIAGAGRRRIGYLPQQAELDPAFPISVSDTVLLGCWRVIGSYGAAVDQNRAAAERAIAAVGLSGFERRPVGTLSAGQFQRVLFARLLVQDADILLLDEPFNAIDSRTTADLVALLQRWNSERRTIVCVLHDLDMVRRYFPQTLLLAREVVAWGPTERALSAENLLRARAMSEAWDDQAEICAVPQRRVAARV